GGGGGAAAASGGGGPRVRPARPAPRRGSTTTRRARGGTPEPMRRGPAALATLSLAVGSGLVVLVLADRALGRLGDPRFTPLAGAPGETSILARPEFRVPVRTNAAGFRGGPLPGPKPPGVFRIVALGDSFTVG